MFSSTVAAGDNVLATQYNNLVKDTLRVGSMTGFTGQFAPDGWLFCDGTSKDTTTYAELFAVIGYTFGGSGSSFNLPDSRGRFIVGASGTRAVASIVAGVVTLSESNLPAHSHTISSPSTSHDHTIQLYQNSGSGITYPVGNAGFGNSGTGYTSTDGQHDHSGFTEYYTGSNQSITMIPSYVTCDVIIKYRIQPDVAATDDILVSQYNNLRSEGVPVGCVVMFAGTAIPTGFIECDGSAISRSTYSELFAISSDTYGAGDGSTTFNVPDMRDKYVIGKSGSYTLGSTGGGSFSVTSDNMPSHRHTVTGGTQSDHRHSYSLRQSGGSLVDRAYRGASATVGTVNTSSVNWVHTHTIGSVGSGTAVQVLPPWLAVVYLIKY